MTRLSLILTVSLALTVALALTAFQTTNDKIFGTYYYGSDCCDYFSSTLTLDKKYNFKNKYSASSFELEWAGTISGTWTAKGDTIVLIPTTVQKRKGEPISCSTLTALPDSLQPCCLSFCKPDTFIYKDNGLWTNKHSKDKSLSRQYSRK